MGGTGSLMAKRASMVVVGFVLALTLASCGDNDAITTTHVGAEGGICWPLPEKIVNDVNHLGTDKRLIAARGYPGSHVPRHHAMTVTRRVACRSSAPGL
jgi:hypothetical protein